MRRKKIAIINVGAFGHVNPTLALTSKLCAAGYDVDYLVPTSFAPFMPPTGARTVPYETTALEVAPDRLDLGDITEGVSLGDVLDYAVARVDFVSRAIDMLEPLMTYCEAERPDTLVFDRLCWSAQICARRFRLPSVMLHASYCGNAKLPGLNPIFDCPAAGAERAQLASMLQPVAQKYPEHALDLDEVFADHPSSNLVFMAKQFHPGAEQFGQSHHFLGAQLAEAGRAEVEQNAFYVSLGSIFGLNKAPFFQRCIDAFDGLANKIVVSVGPFNALDQFSLPSEKVEVVQYADQTRQLRGASAFLTHGGMNSVQEAIWFGVPMLLAPQAFDQIASARRVMELGCGVTLDRDAELSPEALKGAMARLLEDRSTLENLHRQREYSRAAGGASKAAELVASLAS